MPTEATFFLAGLFIIAAATGWAFARYSSHGELDSIPDTINADYLRGLNLVLNRQTEEALELFVEMAKIDEDALETHFALGHLFRRRGEVDKAIRVHQNLLARPGLDPEQRDQALFSLGQDFLSAGLFDRAETLFSELDKSPTLGEAALRNLVDIYEREQEWDKAIETHRELEMLTEEKSIEVAHYHCELAEQARLSGDLGLARQHLKGSVRTTSGAFRASLIRAAICQEENDYLEAAQLYEQILASDPRLMVEVLPELLSCYHKNNRETEFESYLKNIINKNPELDNIIAYAAILTDINESKVVDSCVQSFIINHGVLSSFIGINDSSSKSKQLSENDINRITDGLKTLADLTPRYRCTICGYRSEKLLWHCPSCKTWESVRPVHDFKLQNLIH